MNRDEMFHMLKDKSEIWDFIIIGGGATGLGTAVEASSRGYKTLLLEQGDFAQGTSCRSTKLIHGGVRYLQQGNITLVLEALHERGLLLQNAPHLVHHQPFIVPNYSWWEGPFYGIGLKLYDVLAGKLGLKKSRLLSKEEAMREIPTLEPEDLRGGVMYYDGQFDDARLAVTLARTAADHGACVLNYAEVIGLDKNEKSGLMQGVRVKDKITGEEIDIKGRGVINATGIFVDSIHKMDDPERKNIIAPSQGVHIVLDKSFLPGKSAVMVPHTDDGRVLFAVPWFDHVIVGTTDTEIDAPVLEPVPFDHEIEFILSHAAKYLTKDPKPSDVLSVFAGIRPLVDTADSDEKTSAISRDHTIIISPSGLITIAGGKWTTYRKMAEDTVDHAFVIAGLDKKVSRTEHLNLNGWSVDDAGNAPYQLYGSNAKYIKKIVEETPELGEKIHDRLPYRFSEVVWAVREEMAFNLVDVLSRRTRSLILDARASLEAAPKVAEIMALELGKDESWVKEQVDNYSELANGYIL